LSDAVLLDLRLVVLPMLVHTVVLLVYDRFHACVTKECARHPLHRECDEEGDHQGFNTAITKKDSNGDHQGGGSYGDGEEGDHQDIAMTSRKATAIMRRSRYGEGEEGENCILEISKNGKFTCGRWRAPQG